MRILGYDGVTALVEIYIAPGIFSRGVVQDIVEKFEIMLAEFSSPNVFLKKVHRRGDYYGVIAIESRKFEDVAIVASSLEKKTRNVASQVKQSIASAINRLG